jgi:hypothetical protein
MQVARPELQHQVMIEAVENHMPEVIVIDEIGTEAEAQAARTIAERGVQLVATAHGNELANLIRNPTLCDLVGGIQSVTLGDEEARRRRSQKTVLERAAEPTFPLAVEMHERHRWLIHQDVADTVDLLLRARTPRPEIRELTAAGQVQRREAVAPPPRTPATPPRPPGVGDRQRTLAPVPLPDPASPSPRLRSEPGPRSEPAATLRICPVGLSERMLEGVLRSRRLPIQCVSAVEQADAVLSLRGQLGREPELRRRAQALELPILVIKSESPHQLQRALERLLERRGGAPAAAPGRGPLEAGLDDVHGALEECRLAVEQVVLPQGRPVELLPRSERVRGMQAELIGRYRLRSAVFGHGRDQRLRVFPA